MARGMLRAAVFIAGSAGCRSIRGFCRIIIAARDEQPAAQQDNASRIFHESLHWPIQFPRAQDPAQRSTQDALNRDW
jgi:hypothetical protein